MLQALFEFLERGVNLARFKVDLRTATPDHDQTVKTVVTLEPFDVFNDLKSQLIFVLSLLHVGPLKPFDIFLAENGFPGSDFLKGGTN
jgi:hypothetical protein